MLFGQEHVEKYRETDGREGHEWQGTKTLLLTTTGRKSGEPRTTPLIYTPVQDSGEAYAIIASNGGGSPPAWYLNLSENPDVEVQVLADRFQARARVAGPDEKPELWKRMVADWPAYDDYQAHADREIPVVILERAE